VDRLSFEAFRRNARIRAWRAQGVPVEGGWNLTGRALNLHCAVCQAGESFVVHRLLIWNRLPERLAEVLVWAEQEATGRLTHKTGCNHLTSLLGEDPPEILALIELELLAGG
jgi:hypothetical protein